MPERTERGNDEAPASHTSERSREAVTKRVRLAQGLAFVALVCALVGAIGPAEPLRTTYSWPPPRMPEAKPSSLWYTPLLLSRHRPDSITATIPCSLPMALEPRANPVTVLATARFPAQANGLAVTRDGDGLLIRVGDQFVDRAELRADSAGDPACAYRLRMAAGNWTIDGGPDDVARGGRVRTMPTVNGLFSALDLGSGISPSIDVTTEVHASRTTVRQALAWALAVLAIVSALLLVAVERGSRSVATVRLLTRTAIGEVRTADAVVAVVLLGWWVLSPAFWDDGFVIARERMFSTSRGFSQYYAALGTNLPIGYWLEWTQHWLTQSSTSLLVLRVPSLICLAGVWILCRWMLARILSAAPHEGNVALWALTSAFLVGALAWGMTLRPEPVMALLVAAVMACSLRFLERQTVAPLAAIAILVPLALTAHHTGVVAMAPLLAIAPSLLTWLRPRVPVAATIITASIGLVFVLAFVGSDMAQRRSDAQLAQAYGIGADWRNEPIRYFLLSDFAYGTTLRRASVALIVLAVVAFLLRRRRKARGPLLFPGVTLLVALLLLVLTPSKWPWHFGALLGIAALTVATESARVRDGAARSKGWEAWPFCAVGAACLAAAWSWWPRTSWNAVDLRRLEWTPAFETWLPLSTLATGLPVAVLGVAILMNRAPARRTESDRVPWRVAAWTAPLIAVPLIAFTVAVLVADTAKTASWTLARQNIRTLLGDTDCGLADDLLVPVRKSVQPLLVAEASGVGHDRSARVPPAPIAGLRRFAFAPLAGGSARSDWFELPAGRRIGLFVGGLPGRSDKLGLEWGRYSRSRIESIDGQEISVDFASEMRAEFFQWRLLAATELPRPVPAADVARVTLSRSVGSVTAIAVTDLVSYTNEPLVQQMVARSSPSLVLPNLVSYFPCAPLPPLRNGVVEVPQHIVTSHDWGNTWPLRFMGTSPFEGVLDLYALERLPLADSRYVPGIVVFGVDQRIPGAKLVRPAATTFTP
jgi:hypothetical protein